jgi:hypothetical protein
MQPSAVPRAFLEGVLAFALLQKQLLLAQQRSVRQDRLLSSASLSKIFQTLVGFPWPWMVKLPFHHASSSHLVSQLPHLLLQLLQGARQQVPELLLLRPVLMELVLAAVLVMYVPAYPLSWAGQAQRLLPFEKLCP